MMKKSNFVIVFMMLAISCFTSVFTGCKDPVQVPVYTVSYESAHGTAPEAINVLENTVLYEQQLPELSEEGWIFKGWYDEENPANPGEYKVTKDVTLTALWKSELQVSYTTVFGTAPAKLTGFQEEFQLTAENLPALADGIHTFLGWRNAETGETVEEGDTVYSTVTLEAMWLSYDVTIDFTNKTYTVYDGDKVSESCFEIPEQEGKTLSHWSDGSSVIDVTSYYPSSSCTLISVWNLNDYCIKFYGNNDKITESMDNQNCVYSTSYSLSTNTYTLEGYDFTGWNTKADGSGTFYTDGQTITMPAHDIELYAQWSPKVSKVIFMPNGASGSSYTQDFSYEIKDSLKACQFTYENYRFVRWDTKEDGTGTSYGENSDFTIGITDVTLYAQWVPADEYLITYRNTLDAENTNPTSYKASVGATLSSLTKTGYDFNGWYDSADSNGNGTGNKITSFGADKKSGDLVLYAKWTIKTYTVTFMPNEGSGSSYTQKLPYNVPTKLTPNAFVREDYRFTEWNTDKYGYGTAYSDEETFTIGTSDVTLYARWKALDEYEITYQNIKDYSYTIFPKSYRYSVGASLRTISASGYDFEGWCFEADENGNGTGDVVTGWDAKDKSGDVVLYAKWSPKTNTKYTVVIYEENRDDSSFYEYSPKTYTGTTDQLTNVEPSEKEGFNLQQVEQQIIKGDGSTVVKVYYYRRIYTLTFDLNGGTGPENMQGKYQTSVDFDYPVWEGMTFTGWTIDDSSSLSTSKGYCFFEDATFKANWVKKTGVTVTIVQNDEDLTVTQSVEGNLVSIEVPEAYEVKLWRIDGVLQESKSNTLTIDTSELIKGVYAVYVKTTKDGKYYSAQINVEVE